MLQRAAESLEEVIREESVTGQSLCQIATAILDQTVQATTTLESSKPFTLDEEVAAKGLSWAKEDHSVWLEDILLSFASRSQESTKVSKVRELSAKTVTEFSQQVFLLW